MWLVLTGISLLAVAGGWAAWRASAELRRELALKAYARTAAYDAAISAWLARETGGQNPPAAVFSGRLSQSLRYGENPHQWAAF